MCFQSYVSCIKSCVWGYQVPTCRSSPTGTFDGRSKTVLSARRSCVTVSRLHTQFQQLSQSHIITTSHLGLVEPNNGAAMVNPKVLDQHIRSESQKTSPLAPVGTTCPPLLQVPIINSCEFLCVATIATIPLHCCPGLAAGSHHCQLLSTYQSSLSFHRVLLH